MHHPQHLKWNSVCAANQDRQCSCPSHPDKPRRRAIPFRIANRATLQVEVRNLARRENQKHPARPQVLKGLLQSAAVGRFAKRIDEDAFFGELGDFIKETIRENADVGTKTRKKSVSITPSRMPKG